MLNRNHYRFAEPEPMLDSTLALQAPKAGVIRQSVVYSTDISSKLPIKAADADTVQTLQFPGHKSLDNPTQLADVTMSNCRLICSDCRPTTHTE